MPQAYEKYLRTTLSQKQQRPELDIMSRNIRSFSEPMGEVNRNLQRVLNTGNASLGAKVLAAQRGNMQIQDMAEQQGEQAQAVSKERSTAINDKAAEIQLKIDQEKEAKKKEKAAKNTAILRTGLQVAGMALGTLIPGVGTVAGMGIGGGAAQAVGGFLGIDAKGNLTADPEDFDPAQIIGGVQDIASIYSADLTERNMKSKMDIYSQKLPSVAKWINSTTDPTQLLIFQQGLENVMRNGTQAQFEAYLAQYGGM